MARRYTPYHVYIMGSDDKPLNRCLKTISVPLGENQRAETQACLGSKSRGLYEKYRHMDAYFMAVPAGSVEDLSLNSLLPFDVMLPSYKPRTRRMSSKGLKEISLPISDTVVLEDLGVTWSLSPKAKEVCHGHTMHTEKYPIDFAIFQRTLVRRQKRSYSSEPQRSLIEGISEQTKITPEEALREALVILGKRETCEYIVCVKSKYDQSYNQLLHSYRNQRRKPETPDSHPTFL